MCLHLALENGAGPCCCGNFLGELRHMEEACHEELYNAEPDRLARLQRQNTAVEETTNSNGRNRCRRERAER